ncbi:thioredoxin domain-containing protein [Erythrobacter sp. YT30]|uniref:thioredoxin domain-containing protein n=1 Tax=Erythrobacter sp. YT30 TaxID=1735012 RepID=UPI000A41AD00|nr:thioredoxin domain-containing protein [Erythrobacter sp. YT30]
MKTALLGAMTAMAALALPLAANLSAQDTGSGKGNQLSDPRSSFTARDGRSWHAEVQRTERGYLLGNPDADAALIEFISYTCSHCASFSREADGAIDLALLAPGHMSAEIRTVIRNAPDLTISLLVGCGDADGFKNRHRAFLAKQNEWLTKLTNAPQSQQQIWARGDRNARIGLASAMGFDDLMEARGLTRTQINQCLSDDAAAQKLVANSNADRADFAVTGTPSFAFNGQLLQGVHSWGALYPVLSGQIAPSNEAN